jgi:L-arabinokinase
VITLASYISGHGFGHASRQVEILNALRPSHPDTRVIIRSSVDPLLLERTLRIPYDLRPGACDPGIAQTDSLTHDDARTLATAVAFYRDFSRRVDAEVEALAGDDVALIVGDIPPIAFAVAKRIGVPSIAIGNFTWDWIYERQRGFDAHTDMLAEIRAQYRKASLALRLPFSHAFDVFSRVEDLPLVARRASRSRHDTRDHFGVPRDRPMALLSFGGYGLPSLNLSHLDCLSEWTVVVTSQSAEPGATRPAHVCWIPEAQMLASGFRYEDLVAAADVVVTKPGYGILGECAANHTAMLYTSRGQFREYDLLVAEMPKYLRARFIAQDELFAGRWLAPLRALLAAPAPPDRLDPSGAERAAAIILQVAETPAT